MSRAMKKKAKFYAIGSLLLGSRSLFLEMLMAFEICWKTLQPESS